MVLKGSLLLFSGLLFNVMITSFSSASKGLFLVLFMILQKIIYYQNVFKRASNEKFWLIETQLRK